LTTRIVLSIAIPLLRLAHIAAMRQYRRTHVDAWRLVALGLAYAETRVRIERDRARGR